MVVWGKRQTPSETHAFSLLHTAYCLPLIPFLVVLAIWGCGSGNEYVDQLHSGSPEQRVQAASFLGAQRVSEAIPHLRMALRDTLPEVRSNVIWALGMLRSKEAMPELLPMLRNSNRNIRQATARALMQIEEPEAIAALESARKVEQDTWVQADMDRTIEHLRQFEGETNVQEFRVRGEIF